MDDLLPKDFIDYFDDHLNIFTDDFSVEKEVREEKEEDLDYKLLMEKIENFVEEFKTLNFPDCIDDITIEIDVNSSKKNLFDINSRFYKEISNLTVTNVDSHCPYQYFKFFVVLRYKNKYTSMVTINCDSVIIDGKNIKYLILDAICTSRYFRRIGLSKKLIGLVCKASIELDYNLILVNSYSKNTYPLLKKYFNAYYTTPYTMEKDYTLINFKIKELLEKMNKKHIYIHLDRLPRNNAYNTVIMLKYPDETNDSSTISTINDVYSIHPIIKEDLEKCYKIMESEIPDEETYFENPNNETKSSFIIEKKEIPKELPPIPPAFLFKYLKYKKKYLELRKKIIN